MRQSGSVLTSRLVAGDLSIHALGKFRADGLVPAKIPVADSFSAMYLIAESAILALTCTQLLSGGNCVRISTYVFQLTSSYVLVCQAYPCNGVLSYARVRMRRKVSTIILGVKYVGRMAMWCTGTWRFVTQFPLLKGPGI